MILNNTSSPREIYDWVKENIAAISKEEELINIVNSNINGEILFNLTIDELSKKTNIHKDKINLILKKINDYNSVNTSLRESTFVEIQNENSSSSSSSSTTTSPSSSSPPIPKFIQDIINKNNNYENYNDDDSDGENNKNKEINILLLGNTGTGKTLFINSLINYLKYDSLKEMIEKSDNQTLATIPTIVSMRDTNNKPFNVQLGSVDNCEKEKHQQRKSITRVTQKYKIQVYGKTICLIDTPGIGDTDGIETDKKNFEMVLSEISSLSHLNAIAVVMKPNENRMNASFKFCLQELLCHLHQSARNNLFFIFTSSRNTLFRAGETEQLLELVVNKIKEKKGIEINLKDRMYFFDNECFNYVAVKHEGGVFSQIEESTYLLSWNQSIMSLSKLLKDIISTKPHDTQNTISINMSKKLIKEISYSMSQCIQNSNQNIKKLNEKKKEIQDGLGMELEQLRSILYMPFVNLKSYPLEGRKIICRNRSCIQLEKEVTTKDGQTKKLAFCTDSNKLNELYFSNNFNILGICKTCSKNNHTCHFTSHLNIDTVEEREEINVRDELISSQIETKEELLNAAHQIIGQLEKRKETYQQELEILEKASLDFSCFLFENSFIEINDEIEGYVQILIENEKLALLSTSLPSPSSTLTSNPIKNLESYLESHRKEVSQFKENLSKINNQTHCKDADEIKQLIDKIMNLEFSGKIITEILDSKKITSSFISRNENSTIKIQQTRTLFNFLKDSFNF
ncbi:hypothetical protein DICPUDRAFT_158278 [Dictyostelium purpureum]|uniref:Uncharacterized protein n=1 Tax=Dictyostelium purpureum TaxID=5786 RepID=F1A189_DICPU|nr:uncharacterized protein DICPUDRAFT_158278 [Dictyostelium purpureum]EGC30050.1 hypothetical protein DICPUDRAFT_158278 [Dictyostelium purpureum]|eukprot:XP_003293437.1 hypothetical protein DICPUDRAFT_158278 [Dictyostelium purpureum]